MQNANPTTLADHERHHHLLPALRGGKESLSPHGLQAVMAMNGSRPGTFIATAAAAWAEVALCIWAAESLGNIWITVLAIFLIASRQNVMGLLIHEQTHLGLGGKYGDWVANAICGYPLLMLTVEDYAQVHLAHHRDYFQPADPDFQRKSGSEWSVPKTPAALLKLFLGDLLLVNTWRMVKGKQARSNLPTFQRRHPTPRWLRPAMLIALAGILTATGTWTQFALYWVLPLVIVLPVFVRWGALCEHEYNRPGASMIDTTPLIIQSWWERLLIPNLNFGMHPYHHMFPGIGHSRLPEVHRVFQKEGLVDEARVFNGGLSYLRFVLGKPHGSDGVASDTVNA
jgi:fatty acid desaturase